MLSSKILNDYMTRLHTVLGNLESLATKAMQDLVLRVRDLFDQVIKSIRRQGYTQVVGGVGGGICSIGAGFIGPQGLKDILSATSKIFDSGKSVVHTFVEATKTGHQQESQLKREHELERAKNYKSEVNNTREKIEQHVGKIQESESRSYHQ